LKIAFIIIIIKHVLIKVTLSCQRHCRGTAQSLTRKRTGRSADSRWPQADNSCSVVQYDRLMKIERRPKKHSLQVTTERHQRRRIPDGWRQSVPRTCGSSHWKGTVAERCTSDSRYDQRGWVCRTQTAASVDVRCPEKSRS